MLSEVNLSRTEISEIKRSVLKILFFFCRAMVKRSNPAPVSTFLCESLLVIWPSFFILHENIIPNFYHFLLRVRFFIFFLGQIPQTRRSDIVEHLGIGPTRTILTHAPPV